jgi:glycosyltransferase involved in cell wall biosynthesis
MRVLHFYKTYFPDSVGGIEQAIRQMCVGTGRLGIASQVLSLSRDGRCAPLAVEGHSVERVPRDFELASNAVSLRAIGRLARLAQDADVVHYHFPWPFMDLAHFLARTGKPAVVTYHSDIVRQRALLHLYRPLMHRFLGSVDAIVATSPNYLATSTVLERYRAKTRVIAFGLDRSLYPAPSPARLAHWRARAGPKFFLFVGVLRYYKGLHILLDAVAGTPYPVVIVGAGPIERALKAHAARLGLANVLFAGAVDDADKVALLRLCHAVVFPSHLRAEAFGISLLEGAMFGKPMISSEIGTGTSYINVHGESGLVVPPSDPAALRAALRTLWNDPQMARAMGLRAEERYWRLFTAAQMAQAYAALYRELAAREASVLLAAEEVG